MDTPGASLGEKQSFPLLALRPREAAKALGIGERLLWEMTKNGEIPCVRLGSRLILYPVDVLRDWLKNRATAVPVTTTTAAHRAT